MAKRQRLEITTTQRLALNTALTASLRVLKADAAGLTRFLDEFAAENPNLVLTPPERGPSDWLPRWTQAFEGQQVDTHAGVAPSLMAHVMAGIDRTILRADDRRIALHLAESLEPSGWLGQPLSQIAKAAGCSLSQAEAVLTQVQMIDASGLFAQSLADCLRLQAVDAGAFDPSMAVMLDNLDLVARGDLAALARLAAVTEADIQKRVRIIRGFNPKPGAAFEQGTAPLREPDLTARKVDGAWQVALNRSALPSLDLAGTRGMAGRSAARSLIAMVNERNVTLLRVGQEILGRQTAALETGLRAVMPMRMADIAKATALNESTISRVVAGTAVDTPRGTWWLRALFSRDMGDGISSVALRDRLASLITQEDKAHPMSDDALAAALSDGGVQVARRTVAKYRGLLRIPPAHARRATKAAKATAQGVTMAARQASSGGQSKGT